VNDKVVDRIRIEDAYRDEIIHWLALNGIDAKDVPAGSRASVADGKLTIEVFKLVDGRQQLDPDRHGVLRETITVPLEVEPTGNVVHWLTPRCDACGR
jgi:hypothetical protein